jgi:hypothetical protein
VGGRTTSGFNVFERERGRGVTVLMVLATAREAIYKRKNGIGGLVDGGAGSMRVRAFGGDRGDDVATESGAGDDRGGGGEWKETAFELGAEAGAEPEGALGGRGGQSGGAELGVGLGAELDEDSGGGGGAEGGGLVKDQR